MKLSNLNGHQPSFKQLLVTSHNMNKDGKEIVNDLESSLFYSDEIRALDKKGIDVFIFPDPESPKDRAKVAIADSENKLFKFNNKDHLKTEKRYDLKYRDFVYGPNVEKVESFIHQVLDGTAQQTKNVTKTMKEAFHHFPTRFNEMYKMFKED